MMISFDVCNRVVAPDSRIGSDRWGRLTFAMVRTVWALRRDRVTMQGELGRGNDGCGLVGC